MDELLKKAEQIKIIFFDIDDTLRVKNTEYLPASVTEVFQKLRAKGILTGIATGRNLYGVIDEIKALNPDYFVTANGAFVINSQHDVIYDNPLPQEIVNQLIDWLKSEHSEWVYYGSDKVAASHWSEIEREALEIIYGQISVNPEFHLSNPVYQLLSISDHDKALQLPSNLTEKLRMIRWHEHSSDIVPMTGSKADGVSKILEKLNLTAENMMNFGDELNDKELFDLAGLSVAMEISHPEILAKADYITDKVENDGILKALQKLQIID